jgi:ferredoxin
VRYEGERCTGCRKCVEACIIDVLRFDEASGRPLPCIQCGTCVRFCPHGVIVMEDRE